MPSGLRNTHVTLPLPQTVGEEIINDPFTFSARGRPSRLHKGFFEQNPYQLAKYTYPGPERICQTSLAYQRLRRQGYGWRRGAQLDSSETTRTFCEQTNLSSLSLLKISGYNRRGSTERTCVSCKGLVTQSRLTMPRMDLAAVQPAKNFRWTPPEHRTSYRNGLHFWCRISGRLKQHVPGRSQLSQTRFWILQRLHLRVPTIFSRTIDPRERVARIYCAEICDVMGCDRQPVSQRKRIVSM